MATVEKLDSGRDDGCTVGTAGGKVSFYNETPVVQAAAPAATVTTGSATTVCNAAVAEIQAALRGIGIMA